MVKVVVKNTDSRDDTTPVADDAALRFQRGKPGASPGGGASFGSQ